MTIKVGDYRRFHNDGREPGEPHTITGIDEDVVWYVYDSGDQATWQVGASDDAGSYEECTEEVW